MHGIYDDLAIFCLPLDVRKVSGSNPLMSTSSGALLDAALFFYV